MLIYLKNFVELRTKVASIIPFFYVLTIYLYAFSDYDFNLSTAIIFFISMVCLDMATTALNHLAGFNKEENISKYDQGLLKQMEALGITNNFNKAVLATLVIVGISLGLYLALTTSLLVVLVGAACVFVAIVYSYGPVPIKNTCLGELASGLTMGALIPIAFILTQDSSVLISINSLSDITLDYSNIFSWGLILSVPVLVIANIMLANNICDIDKDMDNGRKTLAIILGKTTSQKLWQVIYLLSYMLIIVMIVIKLIPTIAILALMSSYFTFKNNSKFTANSVKHLTFKYAVFNLQIVLIPVIIITALGVII